MSIRSRIEKFEALSHGPEQGNGVDDFKGKRFTLPGRTSETDMQSTGAGFSRSPKKNSIHDFEADLQEVWSVRKNIHHTGTNKRINSSSSSAVPVSQMNAGLYSRHGAIPAHPASKGPFNRGTNSHQSGLDLDSKRTPLQDVNAKASPWNVRKSGYSYNYQSDGVAKHPMDSSKAADSEASVPAAKRKINFGDVMRTADTKDLPHRGNEAQDKITYAKKMAQGYLKSVGMGEFTPQKDQYSKEQPQSYNTVSSPPTVSKWKKVDEDTEFDFDS